jgi:hypothetical protein
MKQTAVEWLISEMLKPNLSMKDILEQAKEMEMTQIKEAFDDGAENPYDADLYFNKKFKPDYKNK